MMSPDDFAAEMRRIKADTRGDPEMTHSTADELILKLLRELGYGAGADVFDDLDIWYA